MIMSVSPSKTSQNNYSAQSCYNGSDSETGHNSQTMYRPDSFPLERTTLRAPMGGYPRIDIRVSFPLEASTHTEERKAIGQECLGRFADRRAYSAPINSEGHHEF